MKVLLVEDSPLVRDEIRKIVQDVPGVTEVVPRATVDAARQELARRAFGFWLLDFQLPDGTALDLLEMRDRDAPLPREVTVTSNYATELVRRRCLEAGADHFLDKASDFGALADLITTAAGTIEEETP